MNASVPVRPLRMANVTSRGTNVGPVALSAPCTPARQYTDCRRSLIDAAVMDVAGHANDIVPRSDAPDTNTLADRRRRLSPEFASHVGRHDDDRPTVKDVGPREVAAGNQRDPQCREETWRDVLRAAHRRDAFRDRLALGGHAMLFSNSDSIGSAVANETEVTPGSSASAVEDVLLHPHDTLGFRNLRLRDRQPQRLHLLRSDESRLDVPQCLERANHQARGDQQHDGQADLHDQAARAACAVALDCHRHCGSLTTSREPGCDLRCCELQQPASDRTASAEPTDTTSVKRQHADVD